MAVQRELWVVEQKSENSTWEIQDHTQLYHRLMREAVNDLNYKSKFYQFRVVRYVPEPQTKGKKS